MLSSLSFWLILLGLLVFYPLTIYTAWRALFGDRNQHRRRCPRCWFDMSHTPGMTCGECGLTAVNETQLHQRRRYKGVATLAILLAVGVTLYISQSLSRRSLADYIPTNLLIAAMPVYADDGMSSRWYRELASRMRLGELEDDHWVAVFRRAARGDSTARPPSDAWQRSYGNLIIENQRVAARLPKASEHLLAIPPHIDLVAPAAWPVDAPPHVLLNYRDWWPRQTDVRITIEPRIAGAEAVTLLHSKAASSRPAYAVALPQLQAGVHTIDVDVVVQRRDRPGDMWQAAHQQTLDVQIQVQQQTAADVLEPLDGPDADAAIIAAFRRGLAVWQQGDSPVRISFDIRSTMSPTFDDTAVGVRAELRFEGELARRLDLWWLGGFTGSRQNRNYGFDVVYENDALLAGLTDPALEVDAADLRGWELRIIGDPAIALRAGDAANYWSGEVAIPLNLNQHGLTSPPHAWRVVDDDDS